jgi:hypothetical protein
VLSRREEAPIMDKGPIFLIVLVGLLASMVFIIIGWRFSPQNRRAKSARERRADRIDLTSGAKE